MFSFLLPASKGISLLRKGQGQHSALALFVNLHNKISTHYSQNLPLLG